MRTARVLALAGTSVLAFPRAAWAVPSVEGVSPARIGVDAAAMLAVVVLLFEVLALHRVADGSMVGENLVLVLMGAICLSASVVAGWVQLFLPAIGSEQVAFTRDLLVLAGVVALGWYFLGIRRSISRFMGSYGAADGAAAAPEGTGAPDDGQAEDG